MSVFRGSITEYPGVIVDHFTAFNCERGRVFFLSHCHKDHMTGLGSAALLSALRRRNAKLYCTEVTRSLLLSNPEFTRLAPFLHGLPTDDPISMSLEAYTDCKAMHFTVTLLPAGHCPGSAMFLFQGSMGNVLYTGDFRLSLEETKRLCSLHSGGRPMDITTLYLDTTFCNPIATNLPSREVSRDHVLRLTERWLSENPRNVVHLQCTMFGYEHIFMAVAKKFSTKVHIAAWRLNAYSEIPAVAQCLTTNGESTRVHCCKFRKGTERRNGLPCGSCMKDGRPPNVITIKPSTQWFLFSNKTITEPYIFLPKCNGYRVLHSMHASYSELSSFVTYLQPKTVVPCVVPFGDSTITDVHARLKALLPDSKVGTRPPEAPSPHLLPDRTPTSSETATTLRKRGRTTASAAVGVDGASSPSSSSGSGSDWSSGDDTIDEFPSSEEPTLHMIGRSATTHTHGRTPLPKYLALPSMLTYATPSAPPADQQQSSSPSDSVTVGSLQQTPLDLSLNSSRSEQEDDDGTITGSNKEPPKQEGSADARIGDGGDANHVGLSQVNREKPGGEGTCVPPEPEQQQVESRSFEGAAEFSDDLSSEEWCLTLDASTEKEEEEEGEEEEEEEEEEGEKGEEVKEKNEGREDTVKERSRMEDCKTPVAKRRRTDQGGYTPAAQDESHDSPKSALHYATHTPRRLFHCGVVTMVTEEGRQADTVGPHPSETVVEYIDLTLEDDVTATTTMKKERTQTDGAEPTAGKDHQMCLGVNTVSQSSQMGGKLDSRYHKRSTLCRDSDTVSPEVIVLSDSPVTTNGSSQPCPGSNDTGSNESSVSSSVCPFDSPLFLPPTPGREGVESILNRRSIAF